MVFADGERWDRFPLSQCKQRCRIYPCIFFFSEEQLEIIELDIHQCLYFLSKHLSSKAGVSNLSGLGSGERGRRRHLTHTSKCECGHTCTHTHKQAASMCTMQTRLRACMRGSQQCRCLCKNCGDITTSTTITLLPCMRLTLCPAAMLPPCARLMLPLVVLLPPPAQNSW